MHVDQLENCGGASLRPNSARPRPIIWNTPKRRASQHCATAGVQPVLLPGSVYALGSKRYPDARAMIEAGLADGARHRFQSRLLAHPIDADDSFARLDADEDDAR